MTTAVAPSPVGAGLSVAASDTLGAQLKDSARVAELRRAGASASAKMSMPARVDRPWKYLDLTNFHLDAYASAVDEPVHHAANILKANYGLSSASGSVLVQVDGRTVLNENTVAGLTVSDFTEATGNAAKAIEEHLGATVLPTRTLFTALHYAFLRGGVIIHADANAETSSPVRIVRDFPTEKQFGAPHTLIVTGANSRISVIEDLRSGEGDMVIVPIVEVVPGPGSEIRYTVLHRWGAKTQVFSEQRTVTTRDSALINLSLATGGAVVKSHIESSLEGRGSSSELYALCLGDAQQHIDFYTRQDHVGPDTRSDLLFKSALMESSRAVYYGMTRVGLGAKNADANQANRNLLMSHQAKADSDPVLEILTNNVIRVSHGATAGPVDEEQLYYLQARGIPRNEAEALLVWGFLSEVMDRVPDEALREELSVALQQKLEARK